MKAMRFLRIQSETGEVPPFWIQHDVAGGSVHPDVSHESEELWPWAYKYVESVLHDSPRAAELLEEVAIEVSNRLQVKPEVGRNLKGYLIAAFHHRIGLELIRNRRVTYEGLLQELERKHLLVSPNWLTAVETRICVAELIALMPADTRRIVHYRLLDFKWEEIAEAMSIPANQARNRYYYGISTAWEKLFGDAAKRQRSRDHCDGTRAY
jgi:RNA polymerase sigma factor (sigma-70 family)